MSLLNHEGTQVFRSVASWVQRLGSVEGFEAIGDRQRDASRRGELASVRQANTVQPGAVFVR